MHRVIAVIFKAEKFDKPYLYYKVEQALAPYWEEAEGGLYYTKDDAKEMFKKWRKENPHLFDTAFNKWVEKYLSEKEGISLHSKEGDVYETYNSKGRYDWFEVGGGWRGSLKIKENTEAIKAEKWGTEKEVEGYDIAYVKDLDLTKMEKFSTADVLLADEDNWIESPDDWSSEEHKQWVDTFIDTFIKNKDKDTVIAIVDIHH